MKYHTPLVIALAAFISPCAASTVLSLEGDSWTLSNPALNVSVPAHLPSQAHLDLYANQVIGDPYHNLNCFALRFIAWANWTYTSDPIEGLSSANDTATWLRFDGLDTFTSISFCGQHVASTDNQFRQYWFDITSHLSGCTEDDRILSIDFGSAPTIANEIASAPGAETWPFGIQNLFQFPNRWFIRKEQSDFGWDWGPAFAPAGPWKPAYVVQLEPRELSVRNTLVDIYKKGQLPLLPPDQSQPWILNASMDFFGDEPAGDAVLSFILTNQEGDQVSSGQMQDVNITESKVTGMTTIDNDMVGCCWPTQMGPQTLYNLTLTLASADNRALATVVKRVGFRTIVLNELPISDEQLAQGVAPGNNWHFEINGCEFYAKGSNFIPPDAFWPRVTPERIEQLFQTVVDGNQNMLRVWSSGAYSPDFMYDLADEMGILLWSEFEFGDALYPVNAEFLDNVAQEVEYQVRRVNHHPSLAFWAGGNELENLELYLVNQSAPDQYERYLREYETLFLDTIVPILFGNSHSISYSPSSTSNGWLSLDFSNQQPITERYQNLEPGHIYGVTDFYNYNPAVLYNDSAYPVGRFSNEFGYHSMPSIQSWRQQISERDLYFNSSTIVLRNQHYPPGGLNASNYYNSSKGMGEMTRAVQMWYPAPNKTDSIANFSSWCLATQIFQADLYVSEIQFYRRGSGLPERQLGSLYWQLEDIWVDPTWAGVEYDGRWKMLHYKAKDIYEHVIIAPYYNITTGNLSVWVTSDLWESTTGTATFEWYDWSGNRLDINTSSAVVFEVGAINSTRVLQTFTTDILSNHNASDVVLRMSVTANGSLPNSNEKRTFNHTNWFHPTALKDATLVDPELQLSYSNDSQTFSITSENGVASWVWLDYPAGAVLNFDDNAFWLAKGETKEVGYRVKSDTTNGKWVEGVSVQSLWNQTIP